MPFIHFIYLYAIMTQDIVTIIALNSYPSAQLRIGKTKDSICLLLFFLMLFLFM